MVVFVFYDICFQQPDLVFKIVIVANAKTVEGEIKGNNQKTCVKLALFHVGNNCSVSV